VNTPPAQHAEAGGDDTRTVDLTKPDLRYETVAEWHTDTLPDGAEVQNDGSVLFKQTRDLFKQIRDHSGKVIGLMYKGPRMEGFQTLNASQVRARRNIYAKRAEAGEVSEAVHRGFDMWQWALALFSAEKFVSTETVETIHHQPEEAATT
jgi:hypothetical protein